MVEYKLSENIDASKIFLKDYSSLNNRFDATFYSENTDYVNCQKLSKIAKVKGGKRIPLGFEYASNETNNLYLRVANMDEENDFQFSDFKFIDDTLYSILNRYEVYENQLIISIAGTIGKVKVLNKIPPNKRIILTENCAKIEIKNKTEVDAEYLKLVMQTAFVQKQIRLSYIQTTIPKLGLDKILGIYVPVIPSIEKQIEIVAIYNQAYVNKQQKEAEAQALLDSIDGYLLTELGITLPEQDNSLEERIFKYSYSKLSGSRIDPNYNSKIEYLLKQKSHYSFEYLKKLILSNPQYGANEEAKDIEQDSDTRYLRITDIDDLGYIKTEGAKTANKIEYKYLLNKDDVLFARSGSVGKCYIHKHSEVPMIFAGYLIRFVVDATKILPDYLFYYCNSAIYKFWVGAIYRPAVQSNINAEEYKSLPVPLPPLEKQQEIANHIESIRNKAKQLQEEAKAILENAKQEVEKMILGE